jgi:hypothetical protein
MENDRHAYDFAPLLPPLGAVFELITGGGKYAGLVLMDREVDDEVLGIAGQWSGVRGADYSPLAVGIGNTELLYSSMAAVVRVGYGAPEHNDGVLQVSAGDSVVVTYVSASDTTVYRVAVPEP